MTDHLRSEADADMSVASLVESLHQVGELVYPGFVVMNRTARPCADPALLLVEVLGELPGLEVILGQLDASRCQQPGEHVEIVPGDVTKFGANVVAEEKADPHHASAMKTDLYSE
jgi:hypothetical protein